MFEVPKTLGTIEDLRPSMHASITHSQAATAHNCVTGMAVDLFSDDGSDAMVWRRN
jgi:hypothetical protein